MNATIIVFHKELTKAMNTYFQHLVMTLAYEFSENQKGSTYGRAFLFSKLCT